MLYSHYFSFFVTFPYVPNFFLNRIGNKAFQCQINPVKLLFISFATLAYVLILFKNKMPKQLFDIWYEIKASTKAQKKQSVLLFLVLFMENFLIE